ncbi:hypothetical protein [Phocaeicola dorei]|uniref:hypothetical protein n=1 Tax=Phocaeicola dorei TaxID=357276 RepID=UPI0034A11763
MDANVINISFILKNITAFFGIYAWLFHLKVSTNVKKRSPELHEEGTVGRRIRR